MRAFVFTDESLKRHAGRFVWLSMDGEKAKNAPLRRRLSLPGFPSFFVVDPKDERVAFRWVGGFSLAQLPHLLDAGEVAVRGGRTPLDRLLVHADSLAAVGEDSTAAIAYREVLRLAPAAYEPATRALESLVFALSQSGQHAACAALAVERLGELPRGLSAANIAVTGLDAATSLDAGHPQRAAWIATLEAATRSFAEDTTVAMSGDDRSGLWITLIETRDDADDSLGSRAATEAWSACLDREAARAKTPEQRTVYDSHRLSAYVSLGHAERALPMLEQSARDFPDDYNPPARMAIAYKELKRWDEARAASDRALAMVYGPRALVVYRTRCDIEMGRGDKPAARAVLQRAIAAAEALPDGQRSSGAIADLKKRLAALN